MTDPSLNPCENCHYSPDPVQKCAGRCCPFADRREEAPEAPEPEDDDGVLVWQMGAGPA